MPLPSSLLPAKNTTRPPNLPVQTALAHGAKAASELMRWVTHRVMQYVSGVGLVPILTRLAVRFTGSGHRVAIPVVQPVNPVTTAQAREQEHERQRRLFAEQQKWRETLQLTTEATTKRVLKEVLSEPPTTPEALEAELEKGRRAWEEHKVASRWAGRFSV